MTGSSSTTSTFPWLRLTITIAFIGGLFIFVFLNWPAWMDVRNETERASVESRIELEEQRARLQEVRARSNSSAENSDENTDNGYPDRETIEQRRRERCEGNNQCRGSRREGGSSQSRTVRESGGFEERGGVEVSPTQYVRFEEQLSSELRCVRIDFPNIRRGQATEDEIRRAAALTMSNICQPLAGEQPWPMQGTMPVAPFLEYHATPRRAASRN